MVLAAAIAAALVLRSVAAAKVKPAPSVRLVPVVVGPVRYADMPVNLTGLGTVVPTDAVTVHTRVDGQLMSVNFREGQMVRQGDLLMQIDPRPFQVQLLQAEGQLAKDQAALKNARMDLERYQYPGRAGHPAPAAAGHPDLHRGPGRGRREDATRPRWRAPS